MSKEKKKKRAPPQYTSYSNYTVPVSYHVTCLTFFRHFRPAYISFIVSAVEISEISSAPINVGLVIGYRFFRSASDRNQLSFRHQTTAV